jgi:hypothetical protein
MRRRYWPSREEGACIEKNHEDCTMATYSIGKMICKGCGSHIYVPGKGLYIKLKIKMNFNIRRIKF